MDTQRVFIETVLFAQRLSQYLGCAVTPETMNAIYTNLINEAKKEKGYVNVTIGLGLHHALKWARAASDTLGIHLPDIFAGEKELRLLKCEPTVDDIALDMAALGILSAAVLAIYFVPNKINLLKFASSVIVANALFNSQLIQNSWKSEIDYLSVFVPDFLKNSLGLTLIMGLLANPRLTLGLCGGMVSAMLCYGLMQERDPDNNYPLLVLSVGAVVFFAITDTKKTPAPVPVAAEITEAAAVITAFAGVVTAAATATAATAAVAAIPAAVAAPPVPAAPVAETAPPPPQNAGHHVS